MKKFALVDCNNFFVSCERIFNPTLIGKPVVVLSSNDACVIARSNEAKKLGIKMGEPAFKCADIFKKYNVIVFSANFALYGDISSRVHQTLQEYATDIEIYSVDEAFLFLPEYDVTQYCKYIRQKVKQKVGIPVSIGIGPSKTLAKVANGIAKKRQDGVFDIGQRSDSDEILKTVDISDIWGIGYNYRAKLNAHKIFNAYELKNCDEKWARKNLSINGLRTVLELRGISCLDLQEHAEPKKSITVSRAFGKNVTQLQELKEALACHVTTAAEKLRNQGVACKVLSIFLCYIPNFEDYHPFYKYASRHFIVATSYTPELLKEAYIALESIFKKGLIYKKIGVILDDFIACQEIQLGLFNTLPNPKNATLMKTVDTINTKLGRNKVFYAAAGTKQEWQTRKAKKSRAFTTSWNELLTIKI
ncbi:MAG TPA: Y-family DNA polymerase [Candidatus Saccharimonadales bacterium]|nr:Y-family DNA polymerase [Candidatus Saccharimonadales bacterium]